VLVTPVENVVGKEVSANAHPGHTPEMSFFGHLAVLQGMAMVGTRII
jgi:hypothetical protein